MRQRIRALLASAAGRARALVPGAAKRRVLVLLVGGYLVAHGIRMVYVPAEWIICGLAVVAWALFSDDGEERK